MTKKQKPEMLSILEVSNQLGISRTTVSNYVAAGLLTPDYILPSKVAGRIGRRLFHQSTVDNFMSKYGITEKANERLMSTGDVAKMLFVSRSTVEKMVAAGKLKPDVILPSSAGSKYAIHRFKRESIEAFSKIYVPGRGVCGELAEVEPS